MDSKDFLESMFDEEQLKHYGIPGMKWGRRKAKAALKKVKKKVNPPKRGASEDYKKAASIRKKKIHQMSNAELRTLNERLQLERSFKDLSAKDISPGRKFAQDIIREVGKELIKEPIKTGVKIGIAKAMRKS